MEVRNKRVLITGASRGIGADMARVFADAGATVIAAARSEDALNQLASEIGGAAVVFDAADRSQVDGFIERVEGEHGPIDVLIPNAGIETRNLVEDSTADEIERAIRINLITPEQLTAQAVPGMIERGEGHVVFTSSVAATAGNPGFSVYSSTKGGLTRFGESLRMELKYTGVGVTILHLGRVDTSMWERLEAEDGFDKILKRGKRLGFFPAVSPERVAKETLAAVEKGKREVRLPKRMAGSIALNGVGTRSFEALAMGVDVRAEHGKPTTKS